MNTTTGQAIVNKSRAPWRYLAVKIPIHLTDYEKVPLITMEIREMLYRNPQVFLEEDKPQCHIAQFSPSALELAINCNVRPMVGRCCHLNKLFNNGFTEFSNVVLRTVHLQILSFSRQGLMTSVCGFLIAQNKSEFLLVEQEILVEAARIITASGATLGGP